ncbi:MAG: hypothetical protein MZV64_17190 [Ignavibacteriales bacterium]|nr:hypothetical protein [Ignavibacteriales bacterium]
MEYFIKGYHLALRKEEAAHIEVSLHGSEVHPMADLTIALAGIPTQVRPPSSTRSTGLRQHTGNWPGKTVEKKEGEIELDGQNDQHRRPARARTVSPPIRPKRSSRAITSSKNVPTWSSTWWTRPTSSATCISTVQILELDVPVVLALNMTDDLHRDGARINVDSSFRNCLGTSPLCKPRRIKGKGISQLDQQSRARWQMQIKSKTPIPPSTRRHNGRKIKDPCVPS